MRPLSDCPACGGPCPFGRACPHCGRLSAPTSLRSTLLGLALIGLTGCSSPIHVLYGIAITLHPCADAGIDEGDCLCDGDQECHCSEGACTPVDACVERSAGEECACGGALCTCSDAGACLPYAYREDGGSDGG